MCLYLFILQYINNVVVINHKIHIFLHTITRLYVLQQAKHRFGLIRQKQEPEKSLVLVSLDSKQTIHYELSKYN